ncbi:MAG: Na+/H+ antiporter NhaC family protein [Oscillospiraceae bacterium]
MNDSKQKGRPKIFFSICVLLVISSVFVIGMRFGISITALLLLNIAILIVIALWRGIKMSDLEDVMREGLCQVSSAVLILIIVGALIGMWIQSGIVPMIIYYGIEYVNPKLMVLTTFWLCSILSICTGSSWGTSGTVGIACVSIGVSMGVPIYVMVGAAISGATLGDKISPFSDTTIVAAGIAGCSVYEHIHMMMYTTIPAFVITSAIYAVIGVNFAPVNANMGLMQTLQETLVTNYKFSLWLLTVPAAVLLMGIKKLSPVVSLLTSVGMCAVFSMVLQGNGLPVVLNALYQGNTVSTGLEMADSMLNKGGITSMMSVVAIIMLCMYMSGIIRKLGLLDVLIDCLKKRVKTDKELVLLTTFFGLFLVMLLSSLYVSAILIGDFFRDIYKDRHIKRGVLSRAIEEATTITTPLIPWHSSFNYYTTLFGITGMAFVPYAVFCWLNLLISIAMTAFGICSKSMHEDVDDEMPFKYQKASECVR